MYLKNILTLYSILVSFTIFGQTDLPTKSDLKKVLKVTNDKYARRHWITPNNSFETDNYENRFFNSDTLTFHIGNRAFLAETINWTFYGNNKMIQTKGHYGQEPPILEYGKPKQIYHVHVKEYDSEIILELKRKKEIFSYKLIDLETDEDSLSMTFLKLK